MVIFFRRNLVGNFRLLWYAKPAESGQPSWRCTQQVLRWRWPNKRAELLSIVEGGCPDLLLPCLLSGRFFFLAAVTNITFRHKCINSIFDIHINHLWSYLSIRLFIADICIVSKTNNDLKLKNESNRFF